EEGWVETGDEGEVVVHPESLARELPEQAKRVRGLDVTAHSRNFFDCIRTRKQTAANPEVMRRSHVACHAAAIAWVLGRKLKLDPTKEEFVGDAEANRLRSRPERGWAGRIGPEGFVAAAIDLLPALPRCAVFRGMGRPCSWSGRPSRKRCSRAAPRPRGQPPPRMRTRSPVFSGPAGSRARRCGNDVGLLLESLRSSVPSTDV